jgi:phosphate transport system ATP-binding protein
MIKSKPFLTLVTEPAEEVRLSFDKFEAWYGSNCVLSDVSFDIPARAVTCIVGPSGSGKSTLLRSLNRINEDTAKFSCAGEMRLGERSIVHDFPDVTELRRKVGMVFQRPCVFPCSIAENVLFGVRDKKLSKKARRKLLEEALKASSLWAEVSMRLDDNAASLSLGQQQRLCIARTLAMKPDVILLDEPTASVDPVSARAIEKTIKDLSAEYTIVMITHDIRQTRRVGDHVVFICDGTLIEAGAGDHMFSASALPKTQSYLNEEFCEC